MALPTVGTVTTNLRAAGAYPWSDSFNCVIDATATAVLIFISDAGAYTFDPVVTIGGVSATFITMADSTGGQGTIWAYGLLAPPTGATIAVSITSSNYADIGADGIIPLIGTATTAPFYEASIASCTSGDTQTLNVTTLTANDLILSAGFTHYNPATPVCAGTVTPTLLYYASETNHSQSGYSAPATTVGTYSETYSNTYNPTGFALVAVLAGGGGGGPASPKAVGSLTLLGCGN